LRTEFLQLNFKFAIVTVRLITRSEFAENAKTKAAYLPEHGSNDSTKKKPPSGSFFQHDIINNYYTTVY